MVDMTFLAILIIGALLVIIVLACILFEKDFERLLRELDQHSSNWRDR